jgi:hypothetical protein
MTDLTAMPENYDNIRTGIVELLKAARSAAARNVNSSDDGNIILGDRAQNRSVRTSGEIEPRMGTCSSDVWRKIFHKFLWKRLWGAQSCPNEKLLLGLV